MQQRVTELSRNSVADRLQMANVPLQTMQRKREMQTWLDLAEIYQNAVSAKETAYRRNTLAKSLEASEPYSVEIQCRNWSKLVES